eukprot:g4857.t1
MDLVASSSDSSMVSSSDENCDVSPAKDSDISKVAERVYSPAVLPLSEQRLSSILECPVCLDMITPPIYQCPEGHLICPDCRENCTNKCPTCRAPLGNIRNRALEKCVENRKISCKFKLFGCPERVAYSEAKNHAKTCKFRPYMCPRSRSNCNWSGKLEDVVPHLCTRHNMKVVNPKSNHALENVINETYSNPDGVKGAVWEGPIVKSATGNCHFIIHFEQRPNGQYVSFVRFIGSKDDAKKYTYHLQCARNGRKIRWQGIPRSIRSSAKEVMAVNDCLILEKNLASYYSEGGDGTGGPEKLRLNIQGKIKETGDFHLRERENMGKGAGKDVKRSAAQKKKRSGSSLDPGPSPKIQALGLSNRGL